MLHSETKTGCNTKSVISFMLFVSLSCCGVFENSADEVEKSFSLIPSQPKEKTQHLPHPQTVDTFISLINPFQTNETH
jgi:hypothetical protein